MLILFVLIKINTRKNIGHIHTTDQCKIEDGVISTITSACSTYQYIASTCEDCDIIHSNKAIVIFDSCQFSFERDNTMIKLQRIILNINDCTFKIPSFNSSYVSPRIISMNQTKLTLENSQIYCEGKYFTQKSPNIGSYNPDPVSLINNCSVSNIHYYDNSSAGFIFNSLSNAFNDYNVSFISCAFDNTGLELGLTNRGGVYYQYPNSDYAIFINCLFNFCTGFFGGALFLQGNSIVQECTFIGCESMADGSNILYQELGTKTNFLLGDCTFSKSSKVILKIIPSVAYRSYYEIFNCTFLENDCISSTVAGIEYFGYLNMLSLINCNIIRNIGSNMFPVVASVAATLNFTNCTFNGNYGDSDFIISQTDGLVIVGCVFDFLDSPKCAAFSVGTAYAMIGMSTFKNYNFPNEASILFEFEFQITGDIVQFYECTFSNISANFNGGLGISFASSDNRSPDNFFFTGCIFQNVHHNKAAIFYVPKTIKTLTVENCYMTDCSSVNGALYSMIDDSRYMWTIFATFNNSIFNNCTSKGNCSCILLQYITPSPKIYISYCTFESIETDNIPLSISAFDVSIEKCSFINLKRMMNVSMLSRKYLLFVNNYIENCTAIETPIILTDIVQIEFRNCIFKNINCDSCTLFSYSTFQFPTELIYLQGCYISNHTNTGIGMNFISNSLMIKSTTFEDCTTENGAAIYVMKGSYLSLNNCTFNYNHANNKGGCIFLEENVGYEITNIKANYNSAGVGGAFICILGFKNDNKIPSFTGNDNYSPTGLYSLEGNESADMNLNDLDSPNVSISNVGSLTIEGADKTPISLNVDNVKVINIKSSSISSINAQGLELNLNSVKIENGSSINIKMKTSVKLQSSQVINTSNSLINSPQIEINNCKFFYDRKSQSDSLLIFEASPMESKPINTIRITDSCFMSNDYNLGSGDHIRALNPVLIIINNNCCFNKKMSESISIPTGSVIDVQPSVFECQKQCFNTDSDDSAEKKEKRTSKEAIRASIITILSIVVVAIIALVIFLVLRKIRKDDLSNTSNSNDTVDKTFVATAEGIVLKDLTSVSLGNSSNGTKSESEPEQVSRPPSDDEFVDSDNIFNHEYE